MAILYVDEQVERTNGHMHFILSLALWRSVVTQLATVDIQEFQLILPWFGFQRAEAWDISLVRRAEAESM